MTDSVETVWRFPCAFPLKAFGRNDDDFEALVLEIVRRHVPDLDDGAVSSRISSGNTYQAVTATFMARSREQLDALYLELTRQEQVLMVL
jgi:putative lipoic acid-binding regulatory protein